MAVIALCCLLLVQWPARAQEVTTTEKQYLVLRAHYFQQLGFPIQGYAYDDVERNRMLFDVARLEEQRQGKLTAGILFAVAGTGLLVGGAAYKPREGIEGLFDFAGPALFMSGIGFTLGSIPFFIISGNRARERNRAIERARLEFLNR